MPRPGLAHLTYLQGDYIAVVLKLVVKLRLRCWYSIARIAFDSTNIAAAPALQALTA
jgi:hypothetical protein